MGGAIAPNTPYDAFSSAPLTPGIAGIADALTTATERTKTVDISLNAALGIRRRQRHERVVLGREPHSDDEPAHGFAGVAVYDNISYRARARTTAATFASPFSGGSVATADGNLALKFGYFDLAQTARFVFIQPLLTSVNPAIAYAPAETLSSGLPGSDDWQPFSTQLAARWCRPRSRRKESPRSS